MTRSARVETSPLAHSYNQKDTSKAWKNILQQQQMADLIFLYVLVCITGYSYGDSDKTMHIPVADIKNGSKNSLDLPLYPGLLGKAKDLCRDCSMYIDGVPVVDRMEGQGRQYCRSLARRTVKN